MKQATKANVRKRFGWAAALAAGAAAVLLSAQVPASAAPSGPTSVVSALSSWEAVCYMQPRGGIETHYGVNMWVMEGGGGHLDPGQFCQIGKSKLIMQTDGNLVVYDEWGYPRWASNTAGWTGAHLEFQSDGNLVIYFYGSAIWASDTWSNTYKEHLFAVQADGNVVIYTRGFTPIWATNTAH